MKEINALSVKIWVQIVDKVIMTDTMATVKHAMSIVSLLVAGLTLSTEPLKTSFDRTNLINAAIWIFSYDF